MIIAATSDIHLPRNYTEFLRAIDGMDVRPDLFLVAGDVVHQGNMNEYDKFYNVIFGKINCPIVSCFGNNELGRFRDDVKQRYRDIKFLDDEAAMVDVLGKTVGVFGTTGSLETPTKWQIANMPGIENLYRRRVDLAETALRRMRTDFRILLMHYAPTYKTLEGENPQFYSTLGSRMYENMINSIKPSLVVHGHSHRGIRQAWLDKVPIFNVSFPSNRDIVIIDTNELKPGLSKFV